MIIKLVRVRGPKRREGEKDRYQQQTPKKQQAEKTATKQQTNKLLCFGKTHRKLKGRNSAEEDNRKTIPDERRRRKQNCKISEISISTNGFWRHKTLKQKYCVICDQQTSAIFTFYVSNPQVKTC